MAKSCLGSAFIAERLVPRNESVDMGMSLRYAEPRGAFDMQSSVCVGCQSVCACLCVCNSSKFTSVCVCARLRLNFG